MRTHVSAIVALAATPVLATTSAVTSSSTQSTSAYLTTTQTVTVPIATTVRYVYNTYPYSSCKTPRQLNRIVTSCYTPPPDSSTIMSASSAMPSASPPLSLSMSSSSTPDGPPSGTSSGTVGSASDPGVSASTSSTPVKARAVRTTSATHTTFLCATPAPSQYHCGNQGYLVKPDVLVQCTGDADFTSCRDTCIGNPKCISFGWQSPGEFCTLYAKPLVFKGKGQGLHQPKQGSGYPYFYNRHCFDCQVLVVKTTTTRSTLTQTTTAQTMHLSIPSAGAYIPYYGGTPMGRNLGGYLDDEQIDHVTGGAGNFPDPLALSSEGHITISNSDNFLYYAAADGSYALLDFAYADDAVSADTSVAPLVCTVGACNQLSCSVNGVPGNFAIDPSLRQEVYFATHGKFPCVAYVFAPSVVPNPPQVYPSSGACQNGR